MYKFLKDIWFVFSYGNDYYSIYESALVYCVSRKPVHGVYQRYRTAANPIWAAAAAATQTRKKWNARWTVNMKRPCKLRRIQSDAHMYTRKPGLEWCAGNGEVGQSCQQPETIRRKKSRIPRDGAGISSLFIILFWPISPMSLSSPSVLLRLLDHFLFCFTPFSWSTTPKEKTKRKNKKSWNL